jgi:hypothetical protein
VSIDASGSPFALTATQRLDVRVKGDYFFSIGAPVLDVEAARGSESTPGLRSRSIVWAGFDPGSRLLVARATLDPAPAALSLPLRIEVANGRTVLVNTTGVTVNSFSADATPAPLVAYLRRLRADVAAGRVPVAGFAATTTPARSARTLVRAPLVVTGTVGGRRVETVVAGRAVIPASGRIRLAVRPDSRLRLGDLSRRSGRELLELASALSLQAARIRQYQSFLGNPDPVGRNETVYVYRTSARPAAPAAAAVAHHDGRGWAATAGTIAALVAAAFGGLVIWSRS